MNAPVCHFASALSFGDLPLVTRWNALQREIIECRLCSRLREHCLHVARVKRRAYADEVYWGRPVTGFGDRQARIWIIGLAPGAHGANRTGRVFTGDRSGDFLYAALHRAGLANQPTSEHRDDGLELTGVFISAAARCAPPGNRPTPAELENCARFLEAEAALLKDVRVIVALGSIAWNAALRLLRGRSGPSIRRRPVGAAGRRFAHGAQVRLGGVAMIGSYHVSQQNTFTGRLTAGMFDRILRRAKALASSARRGNPSEVSDSFD